MLERIYVAPDEIDDRIQEARELRDEFGQSARIEAEIEAHPHTVIHLYEAIKNYVERNPDMVLLVDGCNLIFKANLLK
jgi:hypothetical protein